MPKKIIFIIIAIYTIAALWPLFPVSSSFAYTSVQLVKDINTGQLADSPSNPQNIIAVGEIIYFTATDTTHGTELWISDGTTAGTQIAKDINYGTGSSYPGSLTNVNGTLFFTAYDGADSGLWKSDGSADGVTLVKIFSSFLGIEPNSLANVNGTLIFKAFDPTDASFGLWKSDGTTAGTVPINGFSSGMNSPAPLAYINGTLFFQKSSGNNGTGLWKSDGTENGTVLVKEIRHGTTYCQLNSFTDVNGTLFFTAYYGNSDYELWKSDGTAAGTMLVKGIIPASFYSLTNVNGTLFFTASYYSYQYGLWKSDGTAEGTVMVKYFAAGTGGSGPQYLTNVDETLFFSATDPTNGTELWKSDGTEAGTVLVKDIYPGSDKANPVFLTQYNNLLYFVVNDGVNGEELWQSDGTPEGTVMVADIYPGSGGSSPQNLNVSGGALYFTAYTQEYGRELWKLSITTLTLLPATRDFGTVAVNGNSTLQTVTLSNTDKTTLNISSIQITGTGNIHFSLDRGNGTNGTCGNTPILSYGQLCTVNVVFAPKNNGIFSAKLQVTSNDRQNPTLETSLTGSTPQYLLTATLNGSGTVIATSSGYDDLVCSAGNCTQIYFSGTPISLSPVAVSGYTFVGWSGAACSGTGNCQVNMNGAENITATFQVSGNVTINGAVCIGDALRVLQAAVGILTLTAQERALADVAPLDSVTGKPKGNGVVDIGDAIIILRKVIGLASW